MSEDGDRWDPDALWAAEEFGEADLGDVRRDARLVQLATVLGAQPNASLPDATDDPAMLKAAYRFFSTDHVQAEAILASHVQSTIRRMQAVPLVLAVQDTTYLDWTDHPATVGLGPLAAPTHQGLIAHTTLALTPERVPLGLLQEYRKIKGPFPPPARATLSPTLRHWKPPPSCSAVRAPREAAWQAARRRRRVAGADRAQARLVQTSGSIGKSKGLFHRRRVLPCRPPCATGSHLPAVLPSARQSAGARAAGAGSQAQTARRQGWFKRLELAVAKGLRGVRSKGLFHRRRVLPCRPPCATGSHLPAVLPSARPARPPGRPRAAGAGSQAQTARRQGWFKRLELAVAKGLRGVRLIQTHEVSMR